MNPETISIIAQCISKSGEHIAIVLVSSTVIHSITLFALSKTRRSQIEVRSPTGEHTKMLVCDTKSIGEFTNSVRAAMKNQKGDI